MSKSDSDTLPVRSQVTHRDRQLWALGDQNKLTNRQEKPGGINCATAASFSSSYIHKTQTNMSDNN